MISRCPKVSVIIPVYKVRQYIGKCCKSLFEQTLSDIEYIFIDDACPDKSYEIIYNVLECYPLRKHHVRLIRHQKNLGVSQSRQDGLDEAKGEYIIHCDPDDWVEPDAYRKLYVKAVGYGADLVICDFKHEDGQVMVQKPFGNDSISVLAQITNHRRPNLHGALWNKLLRREIAQSVSFRKNVCFCEDVAYWCEILKRELKITYLPYPLYTYNRRSTGLVNFISPQQIQLDINHIHTIDSSIKGQNPEYDRCLESLVISIVFNRGFKSRLHASKEFVSLYGSYRKYLGSCRMKLFNRMLMRLAMNGMLDSAYALEDTKEYMKSFLRRKDRS